MPTYANDIQQVSNASLSNARNAIDVANSGIQQYTLTISGGMQRMMSDLGRMMPAAPPVNSHPYMQVRHGMYGQEMSLGGDIKAMTGMGTPETTTMYEYQAMAREDFSRRVANATAFGALNTAGAVGGWVAGGKAISAVPKAFKVGKAIAAARGMGAIGAGVVGGLAATGIGLAGVVAFEVADSTVGKFVGDIKDKQDITNFLEASSFRYLQGDSDDVDQKSGSGFNRESRSKIASAIKKIDLNDSRFNMQDLKGVLERGTEMGMFEGTRDADDFAEKFKALTKNLKTVTRVLHQSLSEGMQTIKDLKEQGYRGPNAINQAVMQADVIGTASGRTAAEMLSIGRQGSEMVRGTGINLATGSSMIQQTYGMLQGAMSSGTLSAEMVAQAGGMGALTQKVMGQSLGMLNSDFGRGMLFSVMNKGGGLDVSRLDDLASGKTTLSEAFSQGTGNISNASDYIKAVNSRGETMRDLTSQYGDMGAVFASTGAEITLAKDVASKTGDSTRDAFRFLATQRGETEETINARLAMFDDPEGYRKKTSAAFSAQTRKMQLEEYREQTDIMGRFSDKVDKMISPISDAVGRRVNAIQDSVADMYEGATDWMAEKITGVEKIEGRKISDKRYAELFASKKLDDMGDDSERTKLEEKTYTKGQRVAFSKGDRFKELDKEFGEKITGSAANMKVGDIDAYSKEVFGKGFDALFEDERMYMETVSREMGNNKTVETIEASKLDASSKLKDLQAKRMKGKLKTLKDAKVSMANARKEAVDEIFSGAAADIVSEVFEDKATAQPVEDLIIQTNNIQNIRKKLAAAKAKGDSKQVAKYEKDLSSAESKMGDIKKKASKALGGGTRYGTVLDQIERKAIEDPGGLTDKSALLVGARKDLDDAGGIFESTQLIAGMQENIERMKDIASAKLGSKDREGLSDFLDKIQKGEELDVSDADKFREIAGKSGSATIGHMASFASRLAGKKARGKLDTVDDIAKFLDDTKTLNMIEKDKRKDYIEKNFMDENKKLDTAKLMKFELGLQAGDKEGGIKAMGGSPREGETIESQTKATVALQEVQAKSAAVLRQLQILQAELLPATKTNGGD